MGKYSSIIERLFFRHYRSGDVTVRFSRSEIFEVASELDILAPLNVGDLVYSFKFRAQLPEKIRELAPMGYEWVIRTIGKSIYEFGLTTMTNIIPSALLAQTKIPDATPGIIKKYQIDDEQGVLAVLRYNRLIDVFLGITCYSLQYHLRTFIPGIGQIETDEIYIGVDKRGVHYIIPVQAKGGNDRIGLPQIEQDFLMCAHKFPALVAKPIATQFMNKNVIAMFEFEKTEDGVGIISERHYRLVSPDELSPEELQQYQERSF